MKKTISIMIALCMITGATFGGRGTIVKDVTYFDADGNLILPILKADSVQVGGIGLPESSEIFGSADITIGTIAAAQRITTNSIAMLDTAGTAKADYALIRAWMSAAAYGAASTNNIEGLVLTGTEVEEVVANGDYWQVTASNGVATATITGTAAGTNYLNVSVGANVSSEAIVLTD